MDKIRAKSADLSNGEFPTIAFFGDSVTQGCFELYYKSDGEFETLFDRDHAYSRYIDRLLDMLYPGAPFHVINAGISGDNATHALEQRLERDVIRYHPDLTVVCFGLNDSVKTGMNGIAAYRNSLSEIFRRLKEAGSDVIFMTPNMMNTYITADTAGGKISEAAKQCESVQNEGVLEAFLDAAKEAAKVWDVKVCDCYSVWKRLYNNGVDTTLLLSNRINHPTREMHWLFAMKLLDCILD